MYKLLFIVSTVMGAWTCNSESNSTANEKNQQLNAAISTDNSVDDWSGKLDNLLTLDIAASSTKYNAAEAIKDYNTILESPITHSIQYRWKKGRTKKIINPVNKKYIDIPADDFVMLAWVKKTTLSEFKKNYHTPTKEELSAAKSIIDGEVKNLEEKGKVSNAQGQMAKELAAELGSSISYTEIKNVGEYAVWEDNKHLLKVFYKGLEFEICVDISNDAKINQIKAIEVAKKIIQQKL